MSEYFSTGDAAREIEESRDAVLFALRHYGAPDARMRFAGKRMFTREELEKLRSWFAERRNRRGRKASAVGA